ncbi:MULTISPECIES: peptidylprolyl isomerase [unclassified Nodularia (in: cyanobacteria)]|uniref:peptidylprolyl isomerase n=1 Tax=unclassified Nodularia (in: cyanobacteria) TaxID=2656917 RepID=UPI001882B412|nr:MULTISPECIES: peptidylprolyl isomerase [unclassified Nodularia (in: cyanobacteria)]MBE9197507.1 peptidylprolyl isomerase [Nodularia sp. LEGE 06071]MCC2694380.1 peptidylprolyl isomerase [Nodularia sp. LEGE 04288]
MQNNSSTLTLPEITPATDEEIIAYLRRSTKMAEIAALTEQDALILSTCEQLGITVTNEELQATGDAFRQEHKLLDTTETLNWLTQQRISVEDWSEGIRLSLLTQKLKEHLFGAAVDSHYMNHRDEYKRVALSQILVRDLTEALQISQSLGQDNISFCVLALEHSKGQKSKENGGFVGICFLTELMPEIAQAITNAKEGDIIGPITTKLGYHILKVEKWFPAELREIREQVLDSLFQMGLKNGFNS